MASSATTVAPEAAVRSARSRRERAARLGFLLPAVAIVLFLAIFPLVMSLALSFTNYNFTTLSQQGVRFTGLKNWDRLIHDARFWLTLKNTVMFMAVALPLQYCLGLLIALVLNQDFIRGRKFFRVCFLLPMMLSPVAVGFVIGRMMFNERLGPINDLLQRLGLPAVKWLSDGTLAMISLIIVDTWQWTPLVMILLLAGLQSLPQEPYEAAAIDGASRWQTFRYLTFPMLLPVTFTAILIRGVEMFKLLDIAVVVTGGGPGQATETITMYAYQVAIKNFDLGYASALSYVLLALVVVTSTIFVRLVGRRVQEVL